MFYEGSLYLIMTRLVTVNLIIQQDIWSIKMVTNIVT